MRRRRLPLTLHKTTANRRQQKGRKRQNHYYRKTKKKWSRVSKLPTSTRSKGAVKNHRQRETERQKDRTKSLSEAKKGKSRLRNRSSRIEDQLVRGSMSPHQTQTRLGFVCNTYGTCKNDFTLCFEVRKHVNKNNEEVVKQSTTETRCRLTVTTTTRTQRKLEAVVVMVLCTPSPEVARAMAATSLSYPSSSFCPPFPPVPPSSFFLSQDTPSFWTGPPAHPGRLDSTGPCSAILLTNYLFTLPVLLIYCRTFPWHWGPHLHLTLRCGPYVAALMLSGLRIVKLLYSFVLCNVFFPLVPRSSLFSFCFFFFFFPGLSVLFRFYRE
jgi:hypothetical protein